MTFKITIRTAERIERPETEYASLSEAIMATCNAVESHEAPLALGSVVVTGERRDVERWMVYNGMTYTSIGEVGKRQVEKLRERVTSGKLKERVVATK